MDVYKINDIAELIKGNPYVGRGIVIGKSEDGKKACAAYFIMGRSANSRNRVFINKNGEIFTEPFDVSKVEDPNLIIYAAVRSYKNALIVSNGDQTDTVYEGLKKGTGFSESLRSRSFEPDAPNLTPRISGILNFSDGDFGYKMSILKSGDKNGSVCNRYTFDFEPVSGLGHFIHTYITDGSPIPTFCGEPERVFIPNKIDEFTEKLWNALDKDNKISLFVRYLDLSSGDAEERIINKNK